MGDHQPPPQLASQAPGEATSDRAWHDLQQFVAQMDRLARSRVEEAEFYQTILDELTKTLAAIGGILWLPGTDQTLCDAYRSGLGQDDPQFEQALHESLATVVARQGTACYLPPESEAQDDELCNDGPYGLHLMPVIVGGATTAVIELVQRGGLSSAAGRGHERLLSTVAELIADYQQRLEVLQLRDFRRGATDLLEAIAELAHKPDVKSFGDALVTASARLLGWDRVSLHVHNGFRLRLVSVSGASQFDRRSQTLRSLRALVRALWRHRLPSAPQELDIVTGPALSEPIRQAWAAHAAHTQMASLRVLTLCRTGSRRPPTALIVCESFGPHDGTDRPDVEAALLPYAEAHLERATRHDRIPLARWQHALAGQSWFALLRRGVVLALVAALLVALGGGLWFGRTEFTIGVQGQLVPKARREIFAPADAEVVELLTQDGARVRAGDVLMRLQSPTLDLQFQQLLGEIETARKRLEGVQSARVRLDPAAADAPARLSQLSAEEQELVKLLESKQRELTLVSEQRDALQMRSPQAGRVMTWDAAKQLAGRPVRRGQSLLAVADVDGVWLAEVFVRQEDVGHLQDALGHSPEASVRFSLATDPKIVHSATIRQVAKQLEWNEPMGAFVLRLSADLPQAPVQDLRPGSVVYGRVDCGERAVGYVWLHDLIDKGRRQWQFWSTRPSSEDALPSPEDALPSSPGPSSARDATVP